jgi:hypothetical protein
MNITWVASSCGEELSLKTRSALRDGGTLAGYISLSIRQYGTLERYEMVTQVRRENV